MSTLEGLLIFAGIPLLIIAAITVLVMAPSLAKGNQSRSHWKAEPEWFGAPRAVGAREAMANPHQIDSGPGAGYNPALAGDHDNVVSDDHGVTGDRSGGAGATAIGAQQPPLTSQGDSDGDQTGGASVRW